LRVSLNWLKDFVDVDVSPIELAERLTLAGLAVEGIESPGEGITKVFTGRILKIERHPNADRLLVCEISFGESEPLKIVTGAPNVQEGQIVPVALEGATLAGGLVIKRAKLRGVESRGMLCSGQELGLDTKSLPPEQAHGVMILPADTPAGLDIKPLLGLDDTILELELTPNRGDCLSMLGVAREAASILKLPLKYTPPDVEESLPPCRERVKVEIEEPHLCRRYAARLLTGVKVGPSPLWIQKRLRAAGVRPISNVVDVTNYVMMEFGQPLHAFDYDTLLESRIVVRRAAENEILVSLDGVNRKLTPDMLIIADARNPVAIAGVMGGLETEVTDKTTNVLLESAYFNPASIRRTSKMLGLRSDASARFEGGIDPAGCRRSADRAAQLLQQISGVQVSEGAVDNYPSPAEQKMICLRPERTSFLLGAELPRGEIADILTRLQFDVKNSGSELFVGVPSWRGDVSMETDLVEEVARLHGYNRIPGTLPNAVTTLGKRTPNQLFRESVKDILAGYGLNEAITYSFFNPEWADLYKLPPESALRRTVKIQNPLSEEQSVMRTWITPGLVDALKRNYNRQVRSGAVFELGSVFLPASRLPEERTALAAAAMGEALGGWNRKVLPLDYYFLKGVLETLFQQIGLTGYFFEAEYSNPSFHPGRTARVFAGEQELGILGELHPEVLERLDFPMRVVAFELDPDKLANLAAAARKYQPLPRFPSVERDIAVLAPKEVSAERIGEAIGRSGGKTLTSVLLFDVYEGGQIQTGYRSLAFSLKFQTEDRTLTDEEVTKCMDSVSGELDRKYGARLRT
jgi:phenylalanyl-tRNA synthetase beta chain